MKYPYLNPISQSRSMQTAFGGYNHNISCGENEYFEMQNMTGEHYPILSPRHKRGICKNLTNPQGILDKESLFYIDGDTLYNNGNSVTLADGVTISTDTNKCPKALAKMGAYVIVMPDKIWYNVDNNTSGYMEASFSNTVSDTVNDVSFTFCDALGNQIVFHNDDYYNTNEPQAGDYCVSTLNGVTSLRQWSATLSMWVSVTSTYVSINSTNIGFNFNVGDGVKITIDNTTAQWNGYKDFFVNDEGDNKFSTNTVIVNKADDSIVVVGIIKADQTFTSENENQMPIMVERKVPDMLFITECNNRLWGCSADGHEIYASKLGDCRNWNVFQGNSMDSWRATIGTDGKWTGAITYLGYPTFFKENSITRVSVASSGGHQTKDTMCRGVELGSERSLCIVNEVLYYKSINCVCAYDGSLPVSVSDALGGSVYHSAVSGTIENRYYISMKDSNNHYNLFVYDTKKGLWHREDNTEVLYFCKNGDELYYIDNSTKNLMSVNGKLPYDVEEKSTESDFEWYVETGNIGYDSPDNKYVSRFNLRMSMEKGSTVAFYIKYDSIGKFEKKFYVSANGTKTFTIPIIPRRCDHFKWRLEGKGDVKLFSIAKITEQGSDM